MRILSPIDMVHKSLRFQSYDLEWYPADFDDGARISPVRLRLAGVYDGKSYRSYTRMSDFLDAELTTSTRNSVYFAHAGGSHDVQFPLQEIAKRVIRGADMTVHAAFAGSSAIIVRVTKGKNSWTFADSYWLLRDSLANIARSLGLEKGGGDYQCSHFPHCGHKAGKCIFYAPMRLLEEYNEGDCTILYQALRRFEEELLELGGSLAYTIASTAMRLFRSRFLRHDIEIGDAVNKAARAAYVASRVEVFRRESGPGRGYDINSSFPHSMSSPLPGNPIRTGKALNLGGRLYLADVKVTVPKSYLPPLPVRHADGRIFFPVGSWRQWYTSDDLELLLAEGGRIDKVFHSIEFEPFTDLADYVKVIYGLRETEKDEFRRLVYKYLLNSLYGKFAERETKEYMVINPERTDTLDSDGKPLLRMISPGVFLGEQEVNNSHSHVPIAAFITARSRALLFRYLKAATSRGRVWYCDTDSIYTDIRMATTTGLGGLKLEYCYDSATFLAPKLYALEGAVKGGEGKPKGKVKAKGFTGLDVMQFAAMAGEVLGGVDFRDRTAHRIRRMLRYKELCNAGESCPCEVQTIKRMALMGRPKRADAGDDTRPWTVREIGETWMPKV